MLMEAAKGGHFETMSLLLDWPTSSAASHTATASELASRTSKVLVYTLDGVVHCKMSLLDCYENSSL